MKKKLQQLVGKVIHDLSGEVDVQVEYPVDPVHGDYSTNVAMVLAKTLKRNPLEIAQEIVQSVKRQASSVKAKTSDLSTDQSGQNISEKDLIMSVLQDIEKIEIAPPGFINFTLSASKLSKTISEVLKEKDAFGSRKTDKPQRVTIEFTDPNPFKEFHIGHLYSNSVGESLARLLQFTGSLVRRVNYQGDVGMHVAKSVWGMREKFRIQKSLLRQDFGGQAKFKSEDALAELEKLPLAERVKFLGQAYALGAKAYEEDPQAKQEIQDINYLVFIAAQEVLKETHGWEPVVNYRKYISGKEAELPQVKLIYQKGRGWSLEYFEEIYRRLRTKFDGYYFESIVGERGVEIVLDQLDRGVFEKSEGAVVYRGEKRGLHTRVFINSLGLPTYEAKELGLAPTKYADWPYDLSLIVTGNEINEYFKVLINALKDVNPELGEKTRHLGHGMVRKPDGSKMSSRSGVVLTGEGLIEEVKAQIKSILEKSAQQYTQEEQELITEKAAIAAVKYSLLRVSLPSDVAFDIYTSISFEGDSGPYLQYTYARCRSVERKADVSLQTVVRSSQFDKGYEINAEERGVLRLLIRFPEIVEQAAKDYAPNAICSYLYDLSSAFNTFYNKHQIISSQSAVRSRQMVKNDSENQSQFRLQLTKATAQVIKNGLYLLGIETLEKM